MTTNDEQQIGCCDNPACEPIKKEHPSKQTEKNDCNNSACNPFQTCKTCSAFTSNFVNHSISPITLFAQTYANNKIEVLPKITIDFWQPPKIA